MLRINPIFNTLQAINYYANHLPSDDYYAKDQVIEPEWEGELSKTLGLNGKDLNGKISIEDYKAIMNNINPISGDTLTQVNYENRRAGYDLTFSVPKSVSLEFALNDNQVVLDIFKSSVKKTMIEIEKESMTRVRVDGQNFDRVTGNILYAPYFHQFARTDENGIPDPHLHCHVVLANVTFDNVENKMKAIQLGAGIFPGDVLIIDRSIDPRSGQVVLAVLNGEFLLKRYNNKDGIITLEPENPDYTSVEIKLGDEFEIWGVIKHVIHNPN